MRTRARASASVCPGTDVGAATAARAAASVRTEVPARVWTPGKCRVAGVTNGDVEDEAGSCVKVEGRAAREAFWMKEDGARSGTGLGGGDCDPGAGGRGDLGGGELGGLSRAGRRR